MKFLIERVKKWYEENGADLKLPDGKSKIDTPQDSHFFKDLPAPSKEQKEAIGLIFSTPFSYIWGAPGTGKTQYVLSYAILNYLKKNKKVAIVAPTNHALEQIFRGVIKMTDKAGISRDDILRLGGPSKKFADEFPEVCEIIGIENELKKLDKQIDVIKNILGIDEHSDTIEIIHSILDNIKNHAENKTRLSLAKNKVESLKKEKKNRLQELNKYSIKENEVKTDRENYKRKRDSTLTSLKAIFGKKVDYESLIQDTIEEEANIIVEKNDLTARIDLVEKKIKDGIKNIEEEGKKLREIISSIRTRTISLDEFKTLNITSDFNFNELETNLKEHIKEIEDKRPVYDSLALEYGEQSKNQLLEKLRALEKERDRLAGYSIEERLRNVSIIGATLDTYLYRFQDSKLGVSHIFLDEAGYSNIVKAMTLFNQNVPVTFLGDHMQLPPVCEISKRDIQNNEDFRSVLVWDQSAIFIEDLFEIDNPQTILNRYLNSHDPYFKELKKKSLTITHRFGNSLSSVLQHYVYPDGFQSGLDSETEIIVCNVSNPSYLRNGTRRNDSEISAIVSLINQNFTLDDSVAILAPYSAQVTGLMKSLPEFHRENKIMTVHKSQGQEWNTVIYSVCDIGNGKSPWFTDSQNSMSSGLNNINTAISRAKNTLIIVCDFNAWNSMSGQLINGIINAATKMIEFEP